MSLQTIYELHSPAKAEGTILRLIFQDIDGIYIEIRILLVIKYKDPR